MRFEKRYCVVEYFPSGVPRQILGTFSGRQKADNEIFDLAIDNNAPTDDYIGISEQWQVREDLPETTQPAAAMEKANS